MAKIRKSLYNVSIEGYDRSCPAPYDTWDRTLTNSATMSWQNSKGTPVTLFPPIVKALIAFVTGNKENDFRISMVNSGNGSYAAERELGIDTAIVCMVTAKQELFIAERDLNTGKHTPISGVGVTNVKGSDKKDVAAAFLCYIAIRADQNEQAGRTANCITWSLLSDMRKYYDSFGLLPKNETYLVCDDIYRGFDSGDLKATDKNGTFNILKEAVIDNNTFASSPILCGAPTILQGQASTTLSGKPKALKTIADVKATISDYLSTLNWTDEEKALIPVFDEDMPVAPEIVEAVNLFVRSRGKRKPVNNFCWRGTTGIGKSTGCSMFAAILETPKLELTCSTNMEEQDFHSAFVPNSSLSQENMFSELPDATTLLVNPKGAMRQCGVEPTAQVTSDDALKAYASAVASRSGGNHFNLVESDYITALSKGYIVEIQEFSRIRDSGVLVKLNKYDKAGAEITLSDGTRVRRAENAVTFWTDNVGYVSNRPVDQSVIRRFDYVIPYREMEHDEILDRVSYNADCQDYALLEKMYSVWEKIAEYCKENDITDGSTSITELESWASIVNLLGCYNDPDQMEHTLMGCVVGKATSDLDTQYEIMEIARIELAKR